MKKILKLICLFLLLQPGLYAQELIKQLPKWALGPFVRPEGRNPIISPDTNSRFFDPLQQKQADWESNDTFNPAAVMKGDQIYVLYRAEDKSGVGIGHRTSRIGLAESSDGITMKRSSTPVLYPKADAQQEFEWPGGCEDPRIAVTEDGTYVMFYTQWNKKLPRIGVATSRDLVNWEKHGPIFQDAYGGKFHDIASKSASVLTTLKDGKLVITQHQGKYWLYWGEHHVYGAVSDNLTDWSPLLNEAGELKELVSPRKGYFDSHLTECGPPAVLTEHGIVLLYNGKNLSGEGQAPDYTANSYCAGQMLFSAADPAAFIERLDRPFFVPTAPFEKSGQYPAGTVFIEGLVYKEQQWFLYYGCADSRVGVAIAGASAM